LELQEYNHAVFDGDASESNTLQAELRDQRYAARQQLAEVWRNSLQSAVDQFARDSVLGLDRVLEQVYTRVTRALEQRFSLELAAAVAEAGHNAVNRHSSDLNQVIRRLRQASTPEEVTQWLLDAAGNYCPRMAVFAISGPLLQGLALRGVESAPAREVFESLDLPVTDAPAFAQCKEACDTVVSIAAPSQVSVQVAQIFHHDPSDRVYLLPVVVRGDTAAILYASQDGRSLDLSSLELLTQAAGLAAEALVPNVTKEEPQPAAGLVQIQGVSAESWNPRRIQELNWSELDKEEQELHLGARRFARVHVADLRLYHTNAVEEGRRSARLYDTLRSQIDEARETFRNKYVAAAPSMIDYLHLELIRSLAHDNPALLGDTYPGPLV
jgi:hypothetical protein